MNTQEKKKRTLQGKFLSKRERHQTIESSYPSMQVGIVRADTSTIVECESYLLMLSSRRIVQPPGQVHHNRVQWPPGSAVSNDVF